jgi:molybdenum cofactor cytidylyltransferase
MTVLGVVLAAGRGSRFVASGADVAKPLAVLGGKPLVERALRAALDAGLDDVAVVEGAADLGGVVPAAVTRLRNERWRDGIASSLQVAVGHARAAGHEVIVVGLADQPGVTAAAWRAVAGAPPDPPIAVASYDGRPGNPVRLGAAVWDLLPVDGDEGARALMRERPDLVRAVPCSGDPTDVDTLEDLDRWS